MRWILKLALEITIITLIALYTSLTLFMLLALSPKYYSTILVKPLIDFWEEFDSYSNLDVNILSVNYLNYNGCRLVLYRLTYNGCSYDNRYLKVYGVLIRPVNAESKLPAIIMVHGYGGSHKSLLNYGIEVASQGFVVFLIDAPGHGKSEGPRPSPRSVANLTEGYKSLLLYLVAYASRRAISVLELFNFTDTSRIGILGTSMGGVVTYIVAATDERVRFAIPIVACGDFQHIVRSGSLANLLITANESVKKLVNIASYIDPLYYANSIKCPILVVFSSNDEFFTIEAFNSTFNKISSRFKLCTLATNWNHFKPHPTWFSTIKFFISKVIEDKEIILNFNKHGNFIIYHFKVSCNINVSNVYVSVRLPIKGFPWLTHITVLGSTKDVTLIALIPLELIIDVRIDDAIFSSPVYVIGQETLVFHIIIVIIILSYTTMKHRKNIVLKVLLLICYIMIILGITQPFISYYDKFMISLLEFNERYGVFLGTFYSLPIVLTVLCILAFMAMYYEKVSISLLVSLFLLATELVIISSLKKYVNVTLSISECCVTISLLISFTSYLYIKFLKDRKS